MGHNQKSQKGDISITNSRGRIRLRWRYQGERFSLSLPYSYAPENIHHATIKVAEIKLDLMKGCFDTSLEKYKSQSTTKKAAKEKSTGEEQKEKNYTQNFNELIPFFNHWVRDVKNIDIENAIDYLYLRRWLEKKKDAPVNIIGESLNAENWSVSTYNRRLSYLSSFLHWLLKKGKIIENPLDDVNKKRIKQKKKNPRRKPLEEKEIWQLLHAIRNNVFVPKSSRFPHSHYYPFLAFIFYTGVRNAEAIGLRVKHLDFTKRQIEISETFARTIKGSSHSARIVKGTKTQNVRYLPMTDDLLNLLEKQIKNKHTEDFVFPSPKGMSINDQMLQKRILKPVMQKLGLGNRDLYAARHSFGTRAVQQGMAITDVAYLMGHSNIQTTMRNYVSVDRPAVDLPKI